jgi:hypothetical protein
MQLFLVVAEPARVPSLVSALRGTDARAILPGVVLLHWDDGIEQLHRRVGSATLVVCLDSVEWRFWPPPDYARHG